MAGDRNATRLSERVRSAIAETGPMLFVDYMRLTLYDPEDGYYANRVPGGGAGYETAPTVSPAFGACIARAVEAMWGALERPDGLTVVEVGPGSGALAAAVLDGLSEACRPAVAWHAVEPHDRIRRLQEERLASRPVTWARDLAGPPAVGCVLANEVLDDLPVHLLRFEGGRLREAEVTLESDRLVLAFQREPAPDVVAYAERYAGPMEDGQLLEVGLDAVAWTHSAADALERGYLVVVDYGDTAPDLYRFRPGGTLLAYAADRISDDPLLRPGAVDLTTHVNFSAVEDAAAARGLRRVSLTTQRDFLFAYGLRDLLDELREEAWATTGAESLRLHAERGAAALLAQRGGMGDFRVLVLAKDAPDLPGL